MHKRVVFVFDEVEQLYASRTSPKSEPFMQRIVSSSLGPMDKFKESNHENVVFMLTNHYKDIDFAIKDRRAMSIQYNVTVNTLVDYINKHTNKRVTGLVIDIYRYIPIITIPILQSLLTQINNITKIVSTDIVKYIKDEDLENKLFLLKSESTEVKKYHYILKEHTLYYDKSDTGGVHAFKKLPYPRPVLGILTVPQDIINTYNSNVGDDEKY